MTLEFTKVYFGFVFFQICYRCYELFTSTRMNRLTNYSLTLQPVIVHTIIIMCAYLPTDGNISMIVSPYKYCLLTLYKIIKYDDNNKLKRKVQKGPSIGRISLSQHKAYDNSNQVEEKIEFHTKLGTKITIVTHNGNSSTSLFERVSIVYSKDKSNHYNSVDSDGSTNGNGSQLKTKNTSMEIEISNEGMSMTTQSDLLIKAGNIVIEADDTMKLKSGSTLTINGSMVKIN